MKVRYERLNLRIIKKIGTIRARCSRIAILRLYLLIKKMTIDTAEMPQHGSRSRAQRKEKKNLRFLSLSLPASLNPERRTANFPSYLRRTIRSRSSLPLDSSRQRHPLGK